MSLSVPRNPGIEIGRGKWILTLDCDITLKNNFLSAAFKTITCSSSKIGILQPKIFKSAKKIIYSTGVPLSFLGDFMIPEAVKLTAMHG